MINPIRLLVLYYSSHSSKLDLNFIINRYKDIFSMNFIITSTIDGSNNAPLIVFLELVERCSISAQIIAIITS